MKNGIITNDGIIWIAITVQILSIPLMGLVIIFGGVSLFSITPLIAIFMGIWISLSYIKLMKSYRLRLSQNEKVESNDPTPTR